MGKYSFKSNEKYAVWLNNEKRCWLCLEPLRLKDTTIDHVIPESLLKEEDKLTEILISYGLSEDFNINGFENWLPCHSHCNGKKSITPFKYVPGHKLVIDKLIANAPKAKKTAKSISKNIKKDKLLAQLAVALETEELTKNDIESMFYELEGSKLISDENKSDFKKLDNGYWMHKEDIAAQGICQCERETCVESESKLYCFWSNSLSDWVIKKRLYWKCYDEVIKCPRCGEHHKRGHIGSKIPCQKPYINQVTHSD